MLDDGLDIHHLDEMHLDDVVLEGNHGQGNGLIGTTAGTLDTGSNPARYGLGSGSQWLCLLTASVVFTAYAQLSAMTRTP